MKIITDPREMQKVCISFNDKKRKIGFVPTMGALHEGHLSLLHKAREFSDISVISIYVNPAQFGPNEDLAKYPRPFDKDCEIAEKEGCDIIFAPKSEDMYPENYHTKVSVEDITTRLCGASRPGHFDGVTTIVLKLFTIVRPDIAVFGQKDAQQVVVIKRMVDDLNVPVAIEVGPVVREPDGLAMSSRNSYLTENERREVPLIFSALQQVEKEYERGERSAAKLRKGIESAYRAAHSFKTEYIEIVDTITITPLDQIETTALVAVACRTTESNTRLIDNVVLGGTL
ncbi:MAG: pantoate--beta-alanine ligase [Chitinivibrionales bacterium]|nr:pantoate--beta-alanine ligase [Chitinivibrionales bacterium]